MPVQAREHIYRGDFKILRGCHGIVCGWTTATDAQETAQKNVVWNKPPAYVFVQFHTRTEWQLPGINEKNVFPVALARKPWYLDMGRTNPKLKVTRTQFPLAPDFAGTTHALQGCAAEHGAIVDIPANPDPIAVYVGLTRCRAREKLMIYRPFPLAPLQAGLPLGRQLLLDVWKQQQIDWDSLRKKYLDERLCMECKESKRKDGFTKGQWRHDDYRVCKECTSQKRDAGTPYRCSQCGLWHAAGHFLSKHLSPRWASCRVCLSCEAKKQCVVCLKTLTKEFFSVATWQRKKGNRRKCLTCQRKSRGSWTCAHCQQRKPQKQYKTYLRQHPSRQNGRQVCDVCYPTKAQQLKRQYIAAKSHARLASLRKRRHREQIVQEIKDLIASKVQERKCLAPTDSSTQAATAAKQPKRSASVLAPHTKPIEPPWHTVVHSRRQTKRRDPKYNLSEPQTKKVKRITTSTQPRMPTTGRALKPEASVANRPRPSEAAIKPTILYEYICPFCQCSCHSAVRTGQIDHRAACNRQFRVLDGVVAGRQHEHKCPQCSAHVWSTKLSGRIRVKHDKPNGKPCPCEAWNSAV